MSTHEITDPLLIVRFPGESRPGIVCLCGSTRFRREFEDAAEAFTHQGEIVLSVGSFPHSMVKGGDKEEMYGEEKALFLDELHKRKIDLADRVFVINQTTPEHPLGYIGDSTRDEIRYATGRNKPITYLHAVDC
jgi:hypothetical protein